MVTMPSEASHDYGLVRALLAGGMKVALHLTVVKLTCNENGDPNILL
jgi:hypothetical protein